MSSVSRLQTEISKTTKEIASGRHADVGLTLGLKTGQSVSLYATQASITAQTQSNTFAASVLSTTQTARSHILENANSFLADLVTGSSSFADDSTLVSQADSTLSTLISALNTSDGERYVFGGTNSGVVPMAEYDNGPATAVNDAFYAAFGMYPDDANVSSISASDLTTFLDGDFAALFGDPGWSNTWSSASDTVLTSKISNSSRVDIASTANEEGMRNLTMAATMVAKLGTANLSAAAREVLLSKATTAAGAAVTQITQESANLGISQNRITQANKVLTESKTLVATRLTSLEGVDTAEAKTRLDTMTTQLQMSYSTTAKLMQLSLLNYV